MQFISLNNTFPIITITSFGNNFIKINNSHKLDNNTFLFSNGMYSIVPEKLNTNNIDIEIIKDYFVKYGSTSLYKDIFLVGCGSKFIIPSQEIRNIVSSYGFSLEWMITKSAIHNWNILLEDSRDVIALFLWD